MSEANTLAADLVKYILDAVDGRIQNDVKKYVDNKLKHLLINEDNIAQNSITGVSIKQNTIPILKVYQFSAEVANIAAAVIGNATIEVAQITELYAEIIRATIAEIGKINATNIETSELYAVLANVVRLAADTIDVDFAQIKDLVAGTAIITKGVGGDLYIHRLRVTDANMVSLTTGELIVKGVNGLWYRLTVGEDGNVLPVEVKVEGDNIEENTIPGTKIIEESITVRELNVANIFADEALIRELIAGVGRFGDLFAASAVMPHIVLAVVESEALQIEVERSFNLSIRKTFVTRPTPPEDPAMDLIWADISVEPPVLKRWDGEVWQIVNDLEPVYGRITQQQSQIEALDTSITSRVSRTEYQQGIAGKADASVVSSMESALRQDINGWQARIIKTEGNVERIELAVDVTASGPNKGVTIREPDKTDTKLTLAAGSLRFTVPGREALVISADDPDSSFMPSLRVQRFVRGNLVTTITGEGNNQRITDQWLG